MKNVKDIKGSEFETEVLKHQGGVVVKIWATWCGPCKVLGPIIEDVADDTMGAVKFVGLNLDDVSPEFLEKYKIRGVPVVLYFKKGELKATHVGLPPKADILKNIDEIV